MGCMLRVLEGVRRRNTFLLYLLYLHTDHIAGTREERALLQRVYAACFGAGEEAEDVPPKSLLELADEPEFNEEISRLCLV